MTMLVPARYSVIYSIDCVKKHSVVRYYPAGNVRRVMRRTEDDEEYEYGHLGGPWEGGHHAKVVGLLSPKHFRQFVNDCALFPEDVETAGSLGAPGFFGVAPAICFRAEEYSAVILAYVTPVPSGTPGEISDEQWQAMRAYVMKEFR